MERCRGEFAVVLMSRVLSVSRAGFYAWRTREPSAQAARREAVGEALEKTYYRCKRRYGAPRLVKELNARGVGCSANYVAKLLRERRLKALNGKGFRYERAVESMTQVKQNMLARDFASEGPNRKWVSDITYIRVGRGWAYLAVVLDLFSRTVVGWALDTHVRETLILGALTMAAARRDLPQGLLLHSDRGVQYRGNEYQQRLGRSRHRGEHEPQGQLLGQRGDGSLLCALEGRAHLSGELPHRGGAAHGAVRIHRNLP